MTTTISKQDVQFQQRQQQHQNQQYLQQQPQQSSSFLYKNATAATTTKTKTTKAETGASRTNSNLFINNAVNNLNNTNTTIENETLYPYDNSARNSQLAATTTIRLDSATTIIQIDSLNNNDNNNCNNNNTSNSYNNNNNNTTSLSAAITATATATPAKAAAALIMPTVTQGGLNSINNNGSSQLVGSPEMELPLGVAGGQAKSQKRRSLLNFKSFDFHLKSLYSGLRSTSKQSPAQGDGDTMGGNANGSGILVSAATPANSRAPTVNNRMPPYLKIEAVDMEESENLLLDYPQSPYSSRRNSSHDDNRSSSQLLHINRYDMSRSPSPYFLSPYAMDTINMRRSSTSDITSCKRSGSSSTNDSRRPSTSDLLRRARERRGSEARMGRSSSHGGLTRGSGMGGRRKSMAF